MPGDECFCSEMMNFTYAFALLKKEYFPIGLSSAGFATVFAVYTGSLNVASDVIERTLLAGDLYSYIKICSI